MKSGPGNLVPAMSDMLEGGLFPTETSTERSKRILNQLIEKSIFD